MKRSSGQALLIVLLVLSVALTAGLSLVARTTTDISISQKETESNRAFEAAEAGIEEAFRKMEGGFGGDSFSIPTLEGGAEVNVELSDLAADQFMTRSLRSGEAATFWLNYFPLDGKNFPDDSVIWTGSPPSSQLDICWSDEAVNNRIEIVIYYQQGTTFGLNRYYGQSGGATNCPSGFPQGFRIPLDGATNASRFKFVNVRFYDEDDNRVVRFMAQSSNSSLPLPSQGKVITSQGVTADVSRRVQVIRTWPELPDFFDFVLFSGGSLSKP